MPDPIRILLNALGNIAEAQCTCPCCNAKRRIAEYALAEYRLLTEPNINRAYD